MEYTRRTVLAGIGATLAIGGGASQVIGQQDGTPEFEVLGVSATEDTITFRNESGGSVDLSGWAVDFEYGNDSVDQTSSIPDGTSVGAGEDIEVASGAVDDTGADVVVDPPFDEKVIKRSREDVIALLDSDGNEVANSEDDDVIGGGGGGGGGDDDTTTSSDETTTSDDGGDDTTTTSDDGGDETTTTTDDGGDDSDDDSDGNDGTTGGGSGDDGSDDSEGGDDGGSGGSDSGSDDSDDDC